MGPVKKLLGGAVVVLSVGGDLVDHARWWLRYQMDGTAREEPGDSGRD